MTMQSPTSSSKFAGRSIGRIAAMIVLNIGAFMILFQAYKMVRKQFIQRAESVAFDNALQIIDLQKRLHIFFELDLQDWMLNHVWMIRGLNWYYAAFMWTFYGCCVVAIILAPDVFRRYRRVFLLTMVLALPWYALYPLAPPRLLSEFAPPSFFGLPHHFMDTLREYGPNYFKDGEKGGGGLVTANRYAAMPSMHIGWSTVGAFMLAGAIRWRRVGTVLAVTHVVLMTITVMATGNHYFLDAVGGWLIVLAAFIIASLLPDRIPMPWDRWTRRDEPEPAQVAGQPAPSVIRR
jgi:diacylglycerol O-acyltransferase